MAMSMAQLRIQLSAIEPDDSMYAGIGSAQIPLLQQLLQDKEAWLASRAVFALSKVATAKAVKVLSQAMLDPRQEIRVAVAASANRLKPKDAKKMLPGLLADAEFGVRKFAIQSVATAHGASVHAKLRELQQRDPAPQIRDLAQARLRELKLIKP